MRILAALAVALVLVFVLPSGVKAQSAISEQPCTLTVRMTGLSASTQLLAGDGAHNIRICHYAFSLGLNATTTAVLVWGTGSTCGTGTVDISPKLSIGSAVTATNATVAVGDGAGFLDENPSRGISNLCLIVSGSSPAVDGMIRYAVL